MSTSRVLAALATSSVVALAACAVPAAPAGPMSGGGMHRGSPACSAPADLPGHLVTVLLGTMGMPNGGMPNGGMPNGGMPMELRATPATVPAGTVSLLARNLGWGTHELVLLPLAAGAAGLRTPGADGQVDEAGSLGEVAAGCAAGAGDGLAAGAVGWTTLDLAPGRYELLCNLPGHYAAGMYQELDVAAG